VTTFDYDKQGRLFEEKRERTVGSGGAPVEYDLKYTYDAGGNRTKKEDLASEIEVRYTYDIDDPETFGSISYNNRLMYYETVDVSGEREETISKTWYYYNESGNPTRIVTQQAAYPDDFKCTRFGYARNQQAVTFILAEEWKWEGGEEDPITDYAVTYAREFRYDSGRARYGTCEFGVMDLVEEECQSSRKADQTEMAGRRTGRVGHAPHQLPNALLRRVVTLVSFDPLESAVESVVNQVRSLRVSERKLLLATAQRMLTDVQLCRQEPFRVRAVRMLLALVPDSEPTIRLWLKDQSGRLAYEAHFTLFCYLDQVGEFFPASNLRAELPRLVEQYLFDVRASTARAAWMAGDLLGDHWPLREGVPPLIQAAKGARFVAGRCGAIHGLTHALQRTGSGSRLTASVMKCLADVANDDTSHRVRRDARLVVKKRIPGCCC
jgi:hypothetical protein